MAKPEDIPQDVWDRARSTFAELLTPFRYEDKEAFADAEHIARAILSAVEEERDACAAVTDQVGADYGEDEPRWFECCETVSAAIRNRKGA